MLGSPGRPVRLKYCGEPKIGAGGKPVIKLDMAPGPSVVIYAIGCFRRAALDITAWLAQLQDVAYLGWYGF